MSSPSLIDYPFKGARVGAYLVSRTTIELCALVEDLNAQADAEVQSSRDQSDRSSENLLALLRGLRQR